MTRPLLTTKLHIPALRPNLVSRPRLIARLDEGLRAGHRLILVAAPAGFGKTTLLSEWIHRGGIDAAWLSLDDDDNDPARLAAYLTAALGRPDQTPGAVDEEGQPAGPGRPLGQDQLVELINALGRRAGRLVLVLDDLHLVTNPEVHAALTFLLDHLPANAHLALATRADPPLPLARLRARGQSTELRQVDLTFTGDEAAAFLNAVMGLGLSAGDVAALEARTEGWIAGLQMAALSLQGHRAGPAGRAEAVRAFTGSHRFVLDYLVEEVLEGQAPAVQAFLLQTSILERLSGPLCDAVLGTGVSGQETLEQLDAANLFIVPLDDERRWYRYHRLFADLLQQRLGRSQPELVAALHRRASAWLEAQGLAAEAIDHALAGGDFERAADLIEANLDATLMRSELTTFANWVERLPDEWLRGRPTLCFYSAWALLMSGQSLEVVQGRLAVAAGMQEGEADGVMAGRMAALRAYRLLFQADVARAAELCRLALEKLPESDRFLRGIVAWLMSLTRLSEGDLQGGEQALQELVRLGCETGNPLIAVAALSHQAVLQKRQGRLGRARQLLEQALDLATDSHGRRLPIASEALLALGDLEREWNQLEAAAEHLTEGIELARQWSELAAFDGYLPLMRLRLAQGDVEAARQALEAAQGIALKSEITQMDDRVADLQRAFFLASQGDLAGAMRWAEERGLPRLAADPGPALAESSDAIASHLLKYELLMLARLFVLQGRAGQALELLEALLAHAGRLSRVDLTIEVQILRALGWQTAGDEVKAMAALSEALALTEPEGYRRVYLDEGEPMVRLLRRAAARGLARGYLGRLLAVLGEPEAPAVRLDQPLVEPLSERELEVLRLLAAGLSNAEIADELVVAVSTVRSHCKSIYGKLGVHRRWDAVGRAQELGLI